MVSQIVKIEAFQRLSELHYIRECMIHRPEIFDSEVLSAAWDWVNNDIAELEGLLFGENEKATGQGYLDVEAFKIIDDFSIPTSDRVGKEVQVNA